MNKRTKLLIERAYDRLDVLNDIDHRRYLDRLFEERKLEERIHRAGNPKGFTGTVDIAAKLFIVRDLARFATGKELPTIADFVALKPSYMYAASLFANFGGLISANLRVDAPALAELDYVKECCK